MLFESGERAINFVATGSPLDESIRCADLWPVYVSAAFRGKDGPQGRGHSAFVEPVISLMGESRSSRRLSTPVARHLSQLAHRSRVRTLPSASVFASPTTVVHRDRQSRRSWFARPRPISMH